MELTTREKYISDLRIAADFFERHPEIETVPRPYLFAGFNPYSEEEKTESRRQMQLFIRAATKDFGKVEKEYDNSERFPELQASTYLPGGLMIRYDIQRDLVCERVVVETKTVPAHTLPARDEIHIPEKIEEVIEWRCSPLLSEVEHV